MLACIINTSLWLTFSSNSAFKVKEGCGSVHQGKFADLPLRWPQFSRAGVLNPQAMDQCQYC